MAEPTEAEIVQELFRRRSTLTPQQGEMLDQLMRQMISSGEIRGAPPAPPAPPEPTPHALSRFGTSLVQMINPIPAIQEYIDRPKQWGAMGRGLEAVTASQGRERTPEEQAVIAQGLRANVGAGQGLTLPMMSEPLFKASYEAQQGNLAGAAGTLTGGYGAPAVIGKAVSKLPPLPGSRQELAVATGRALERTETALLGPREPIQMMTQALKPRAANAEFSKHMHMALPELKASEVALGRPIANVGDLLEAVKIAKARVWAEREAIAGGQKLRSITLDPVADAIERTISARTKLMGGADPIRAVADKYRGKTFTIQEVEEFLKGANAELDAYYAKNPSARQISKTANPDTAALVAEAETLRKQLYGTLDHAGQGAGPRELSRRYGALIDAEQEAYRRKNVADRQAQMGLAEQFGTGTAAVQAVRGVGQIVTGRPFKGLANIADAYGMRRIAHELSEMNKTDRLIERTFRNYTRRPQKVTVKPVEIKGFLPSPLGELPPPPDSSGVRSIPGMYPAGPDPRRSLGPGPIIPPPPADPSGVQIIDAARGIARDPKTGRMFRYYR